MECNYTEATWNIVAAETNMPNYNELMAHHTPTEGVNYLLASGSQTEKRRKMGVLFSFWWELWKERNRRIFDNNDRSPAAVATVTLEAIKMINFALST